MVEAVENKLKIDFSQSMNSQELSKIIEKYEVEGTKFELENQGFVLNQLFEKYVQPDLIQPTFVYWYPLIISPLAKRHAASSDFTDRFELFINGHEIANGFAELNDPEEQKIRFQVQQQAKRQGGQNDYHNFDQSFIEALEYGLPPTFGLGIGIDRVVMMYCGEAAIREVILFPSLRAKK